MKTKSWIFLLGALLFVCLLLSYFFLSPRKNAGLAEIRSDGKRIKIVSLARDQEFTVISPSGGENTVTVRGGTIAVTAATCPDHYCMHRGFCSGGSSIVCLPNRLVITFLDDQEVDFVVG